MPRSNGDVGVRFVNAAGGPLSVRWDGQVQLDRLDVGDLSVPLPLPTSGTTVTITGEQQAFAEHEIVPQTTDQLVVIHTNGDANRLEVATFSQSAPPSTLNAHLRLINVLPDITALSLELRIASAALEATPVERNWEVALDSIRYGQASPYVRFGSELYDVRVTLAGTETVIATLPEVQLIAGSIYDFVVAPGSEPGSARLLLAQPDVQTGLGLGRLDPLLLEQVQATLTAMVPAVVNILTYTPTATPTITPVFTNTPHPTNTPSVRAPSLLADPPPPLIALGSFTLLGQDFAPFEDYAVSLVPSRRILYRGRTDENGSLVAVIGLPANLPDGLYVVRVCTGCEPDGAQQEAFAVINAVFPTPSPVPRIIRTAVPPTSEPALPTSQAPAPAPPPDEPPDEPPPPGAPHVPIPPTPVPPTAVPPTDVPPVEPPPAEPPTSEPPPPEPPPAPPPPEPPPPEPPPPEPPPAEPAPAEPPPAEPPP